MLRWLTAHKSRVLVNVGILTCLAAGPGTVFASGTPSQAGSPGSAAPAVTANRAAPPTGTDPSNTTSCGLIGDPNTRENSVLTGSSLTAASKPGFETFQIGYVDEWPMDASDLFVQVNGGARMFFGDPTGNPGDAHPAVPTAANSPGYVVVSSTEYQKFFPDGSYFDVSGDWTWGHAKDIGSFSSHGGGYTATIKYTYPAPPGADVTVLLWETDGDHCGDSGQAVTTFKNPVVRAAITGHIYLNNTTTEVTTPNPGQITLVQPAGAPAIAGQPNPSNFTNLPAPATYGATATAPAGYVFVPNPTYTVNTPTTATLNPASAVNLTPGATGNVVFYVQPAPGTITGHIYQSGTTTEAPPGQVTLVQPAGSPAIPGQPNPANFTNVPPGTYGSTAVAPSGYQFVPNPTYTVGPGGTTATLNPASAITLAAGGTGNVVYFVDKPAFSLTKTVDPAGTVAPGSRLHYTVTVKNTSQVAGSPGSLDDKITTSAGATYHVVSGPTAQPGGAVTNVIPNVEWTWAVPSLDGGASATLTLDIVADTAGLITNTASLPNLPPATVVTPVSGFSLSKTVTPTGTVAVGTPLHYVVTVTNIGPVAAAPGVVHDVLTTSGGAAYHVTGGPTPSAGTVSPVSPGAYDWTVPVLQPQGTATLTFDIVADAAGLITNTATLAGLPPAVVNTPVVAPAFSITKTVTPTGAVSVGTSLHYVVTVTNTSPVPGDPGTVDDTIATSGGATYHVTGGPTASTGKVTTVTPSTEWHWAVGSLNGQQSATLTLDIVADSPGTITNSASLPNQPPVVVVTPVQGVTVTKTVSKATAQPGDTLTYTVTVTNVGGASLSNVLVDDLMTGTAAFIVNDGTNGTSNSFAGNPGLAGAVAKLGDGHYQWTFASLAPAQKGIVTYTAVINSPGSTATAVNGLFSLVNTATTAGAPPASVTTTIPQVLTGVKALEAPPVSPPTTGAELNWRPGIALLMVGMGLIGAGLATRKRQTAV